MYYVCQKYRIEGIFRGWKTFVNFAVSEQYAKKPLTAKVFIAKISTEYCGIIINGRVIVISHNSQKFQSWKSDFQQFMKAITRERFPPYDTWCI